MDKKHALIISKWLIANHREIINNIGEEATRNLWRYAEANGVLLRPQRRGRPVASSDLDFNPGGEALATDVENAIFNYRVKNADDLARLFGILTRANYIDAATPIKTFYNYWGNSIKFPWETYGPIFTYKAFTEAVSRNRNAPNNEQIKMFENLVCEMAMIRINRGNEEQYITINGDSFSMSEYKSYLEWMYESD